MKILALDTANNSASVAISDGEKILAYKEELRPGMQAETIMPMIESALEEACLSYESIPELQCLCHKRLSHLNFKNINMLSKQKHVRGLPTLTYKKDKICSACVLGK